MFSFFKKFSSKAPFEQDRELQRLQPLSFIRVTSEHYQRCLQIHKDCESETLPAAHRPIFEQWLKSEQALLFLVYREQTLVGCCGVQWTTPTLAWLCYGLVLPAFRRTGIGTTMFFTRMSLLKSSVSPFSVGMSAIAANFSFYKRLGFYQLPSIPADCADGHNYPVAVLDGMTPQKVESYRKAIEQAGVQLSPDIVVPQLPEEDDPIFG